MNKLEPLSMTTIYSGIPDDLTATAHLKANGTSVPVRALWDTGSNKSSIPMIMALNLCLESEGLERVNSGSGSGWADVYHVDIELENGIIFHSVKVVASHIDTAGLGLLIGWDIISQGDFRIRNVDGNTVLTFCLSSQQDIDAS